MFLLRDTSHTLPASVVTIGNFDGVHLGHQRLIEMLCLSARQLQLPSVVLTFHPHPSEYFHKDKPAARLMRFREKWKALEPYEIDYLYVARFNAALAKLSAEEFIQKILVDQLQAKKIIVGDDFQFGAKRLGNVALLKALGRKYGFEVEALTQTMHERERISSSRIREALRQNEFMTVRTLSGRAYTLSGKIAYGNQIGRTLGFPTANIHLRRKQVPMMGIFVVRVFGLSQAPLPGVASVGYRPTFNGKEILLEVHLLDFDKIIYGKRLTVEFI